jgi:hypothetical protein
VTREDGSEFGAGQSVDVRFMLPDNDPATVQNGTWTIPSMPADGRKTVERELGTGSLPRTVGVPFQLCTSDLQGGSITGTVTKVLVQITLNEGATAVQALQTQVDLRPRTAETAAIERVREKCNTDAFDSNLVVTQVKRSSRVGGQNRIVGTLFRAGVPSPHDPIELYTSDWESSAPLGDPIDKTTTDAKGAFEFTFPMARPGKYGFAAFEVIAHERTEPIGPILGPFPGFGFKLIFNVPKGARYERGLTDWIPRQSAACLSAYGAYSVFARRPDRTFNDERHPLLVYAAHKAFPGSTGKRSYASSRAWQAATGGKCYVSWWENQYGQRVSGYTYWCERDRR